MEKRKVAVLGATGIVGQMFLKMLEDHPMFDVALLSASADSAGKKYSDAVNWVLEGGIPEYAANMNVADSGALGSGKGFDIAFSALPSEVAETIERKLAHGGRGVFSNAASHRMYPEVPVLIPELNAEHMALVDNQKKKTDGFIVCNSNCTTSGIVMALKPLLKFGVKAVTVSSYQALSGAGHPGVPSLDALGNVIPFIKDEEEKVINETRKMLGTVKGNWVVDAPIDVMATCVRVPVRNGHLETAVVELEKEPSMEDVKKALKGLKGMGGALPTAPVHPLIVREEGNRPQPSLDVMAGTPERARGMAVSVGRLHFYGKRLRFVSLVNNLVRGAAGGAILNAEYAITEKYI